MDKLKSGLLRTLPGLILLYAILLIPDSSEMPVQKAAAKLFLWDQDQTWERLEEEFVNIKKLDSAKIDFKTDLLIKVAEVHLNSLNKRNFSPTDITLSLLLSNFFNLVPYIAVKQ